MAFHQLTILIHQPAQPLDNFSETDPLNPTTPPLANLNYQLSRNEISTFTKLRISSHDLHIEKGRHRKIILSERKCFLCNKFVEDEKHFVVECFSLSAHRNTFFDE